MHADQALYRLLGLEFESVLDVGSGGKHADVLRMAGKRVTTINLYDADIVGDYLEVEVSPVDCIWASHVLEHMPNPNLFLRKCFRDLNDGGILAVTVPPAKPEIVGGHVTLWNAGLLLYNLILAGFDCSKAMVKSYGYNVSVIARKVEADLPELSMDCGDIEKLAKFFPFDAKQGFNGEILEVNW